MKVYTFLFTFILSISAIASDSFLITVKNNYNFEQDFSNFYGQKAYHNKIKNLQLTNLNVFHFTGNINELEILKHKTNSILRIEKNVDLSHQFIEEDSLFKKQWHLNNTGLNSRTTIIVPGKKDEDINAKKAWEISKGSNEIVIAVIDSGIDYNHPDLKANIWTNEVEKNGIQGIDDDGNGLIDDIHGYDFINNDNDPIDDNGHGTHCSGIIGAVHNNGGIRGVMAKVKIMPLKFIPKDGVGKMFAVLKAIDYAINNGAHIISNSWGGAPKESALFDILKIAAEKGIFIVNAAGNSNLNSDKFPLYPAGYKIPGLMSIGATMGRGSRANFSNFGAKSVDVFAPGQGIFSTWKNGKYKKQSGTSMATPIVAGIAGLALSIRPNLTPVDLKQAIIKTSKKLKTLQNKSVGGRVDAFKLLQEL